MADFNTRKFIISKELEEKVKSVCKGKNLSQIFSRCLEKYLDIIRPSTGEVPVLFKIPFQYKTDPEGLKKWLNIKVDALVEKFCQKSEFPELPPVEAQVFKNLYGELLLDKKVDSTQLESYNLGNEVSSDQ